MKKIESFKFTQSYEISRIIKGCWQLAGGHGQIDRELAMKDMLKYLENGITTFDCADIYTGVEELIGDFFLKYKTSIGKTLPSLKVHTKFVPDLDMLDKISGKYVEGIIDRSLSRLKMERLDLVQFHWWDYEIPGFVEAALELQKLQKKGKINNLGVTNFDVAHLEQVIQAGVKIVSNQTQYSVLDHRPEHGMVDFCRKNNIYLLCYGTLAGGLLNEKYLGIAKPLAPYENRSLAKYMLILDEFGNWDDFQDLLITLQEIARKHQTTLSNVATRYVLQKAQVAATIVGSRDHKYLQSTKEIFGFELDQEDLRKIQQHVLRAKGPKGDTYDLERQKNGVHASIMKYNLNKV